MASEPVTEAQLATQVVYAQETIDQWENGQIPSARRAVVHAHHVQALATEVLAARARIAELEAAVLGAEWSGDCGTDPTSFVCPFCHRAHSEMEWARGVRDHEKSCIVLTAKAPSGEETR